MKKTTKFISAFMAAILCFNLVSFSAFAAEPSATETSFLLLIWQPIIKNWQISA